MSVYCCAKATNEDNYLLQKMFRALFRTNNVDHCTRLCHAGSVVALQQALGSSAMSNTASEVIHNDVLMVVGSNTSENHPIIALQMKAAIREHGAKLIVVDPRRIDLVDFAELWLPLKPGTNVPVLSAMAHVIVKEGLVNDEFVKNRTEGFDDFIASLEKFTPEYAEEISGVPADDIRKAARLYASAENGSIYWGMGISQLSHGTASALALIHLAFLTGHIGREGTGLNPLRGQNNVQGASDMGAMPFHYPGYMLVSDEENAKKWEAAWNIEPGGLSRELGLTTTEILSSRPSRRRARALHHGREPDDVRAQSQRDPQTHGATGVPRRPGSVHQRVRRVCGCLPPGCSLRRKRRHLHQHRPPRPARATGASSARKLARRLGDHLRSGTCASNPGWSVPPPNGPMPAPKKSTLRWRAWCPILPV